MAAAQVRLGHSVSLQDRPDHGVFQHCVRVEPVERLARRFGGTRVVALANWPGRIETGDAQGVMHVMDMLPTLATLDLPEPCRGGGCHDITMRGPVLGMCCGF